MTTFYTPEQFVAAGKASLEKTLTAANSAFARVERLSALNLNTARAVFDDSVASVKALSAVQNPQELLALQSKLGQPVADKAVGYARSVQEIVAEGQQEFARLVEAEVADLNNNVAAALDQAAKSAPAGSEGVFSAIKSAIAMANSLFDNASKAARQASEAVESNLAVATDATVKAVSAVARKAA